MENTINIIKLKIKEALSYTFLLCFPFLMWHERTIDELQTIGNLVSISTFIFCLLLFKVRQHIESPRNKKKLIYTSFGILGLSYCIWRFAFYNNETASFMFITGFFIYPIITITFANHLRKQNIRDKANRNQPNNTRSEG